MDNRNKRTIDNSPVYYPPSNSPKSRGDKRFSTLNSLAATRGAYIDTNGVRWDTNNADFEGFLSKKSKWMGEWRKRYFILKGSKMFFSKAALQPPHGMIDLVDCVAVKSAEALTKKRNSLEVILKKERFLLMASTEADKDEWIGQIGRALVKNSGMFIDDQGKNEYEEDDISDYSDDGK